MEITCLKFTLGCKCFFFFLILFFLSWRKLDCWWNMGWQVDFLEQTNSWKHFCCLSEIKSWPQGWYHMHRVQWDNYRERRHRRHTFLLVLVLGRTKILLYLAAAWFKENLRDWVSSTLQKFTDRRAKLRWCALSRHSKWLNRSRVRCKT